MSDTMNDTMNDAPAGAPEHADGGNVDKIRDILFGAQMRDYDHRFAALEERLLRESAQLRDDMGRRLSATEQFLRGELDALSASLAAEQRDRVQGVREAMDALAAVNRELADRIAALAEQTAQQQREMRLALNDQQRSLSDEMERRHQELSEALRREAFELRTSKTDRHALAAMFAELAQRVTSDVDAR